MLGSSIGIKGALTGTEVRLTYNRGLTQKSALDVGAAVVSGWCWGRSDERDCVFTPGHSFEITGGLKLGPQTAIGFQPYGRLVAGMAIVQPVDSATGYGIVGRGGLGAKYRFSSGLAIGLDAAFGVGGAAYAGKSRLSSMIVEADLGLVGGYLF
jgi:hypothetical protein